MARTPVEVSCYLVITAEVTSLGYVRNAKVDRVTQKKPAVPRNGIHTKVTLMIDPEMFDPTMPEAIIRVDRTNATTVVVTNDDPELEETDSSDTERTP